MKVRSGVALDDARGHILPFLSERELRRDRHFFAICFAIGSVLSIAWLVMLIYVILTLFSL